MKNILLYGVSSNHGGVETYVFNLVEQLDKKEFNLFLLVNSEDYPKKDWLKQQGVQVIVGPSRRKQPLTYQKELRKILREHNIDMVWSNLCSLSDIGLIKAAKAEKLEKRIVYAHQSDNMGGKLTGLLHEHNKKGIGEWATHYWACSHNAWDYFFKGSVSEENRQAFPNAVDTAKYAYNLQDRQSVQAEFQSETRFVIGTVGRLSHEKNHQFLLKVMEELRKEMPDVLCLIVGQGETKGLLLEEIEKQHLQDHVKLLGVRQDVARLMNGFDVFVLPSKFEGLPFVLVEAQMNGLPCVVSDLVSTESKFTETMDYLPLDVSVWVERLKQLRKQEVRQGLDEKIAQESPFNIKKMMNKIHEELNHYE